MSSSGKEKWLEWLEAVELDILEGEFSCRKCVSEPGMGGCADLGLTLLGSGVDVHGGSCVFMRVCVCWSLLCVLN